MQGSCFLFCGHFVPDAAKMNVFSTVFPNVMEIGG